MLPPFITLFMIYTYILAKFSDTQYSQQRIRDIVSYSIIYVKVVSYLYAFKSFSPNVHIIASTTGDGWCACCSSLFWNENMNLCLQTVYWICNLTILLFIEL